MTDLKERLTRVEGFPPPDLWSEIEDRASTPGPQVEQDGFADAGDESNVRPMRLPSARRKLAVASLAFLLAAASLYGIVVAFRGTPRGAETAVVRNGLIAYVGIAAGSARGNYNLDLFTVNPATGRSTDLTRTPRLAEDQAAWTRDGSRVVFVAEVGIPLTRTSSSSTDELYVMNADGSGVRKLPVCSQAPCRLANPAWSPDGTRIAFIDFSHVRSLQIYDLASGAISTICDARRCGDGIAQPAWSPDGRRVTFSNSGVVERTGPFDLESSIWVAAADGSSAKRLTSGPTTPDCQSGSLDGCYFDVSPSWSPDGSTIVFSRLNEGSRGATPTNPVAGVELIGSNGGPVRSIGSCASDCLQSSAPVFSPDGSEVAAAATSRSIEVIGIQGQTVRAIETCLPTRCLTPATISWAPEGDSLAFIGDAPSYSAVYVVDVGGQGLRQVADGAWNTLSWLPRVAAPSTPSPPAIAAVPPVTVQATQRFRFPLGSVTAAQEGFGSLWVAVITSHGQEVLRVDPATGATQHVFPLPSISAGQWGGKGIAIGARSVWVAGADHHVEHAFLFRIDPATDTVDPIGLPGRGVDSITFQAGTLWALVPQQDNLADIVGIDPTTQRVVSTTPFHADWYSGIFPTAGTVWVKEASIRGSSVVGGTITQIVPGGIAPVQTGGTFAEPVTDGTSLWTPFFGDSVAMNMSGGIARIDPVTGRILGTWKTDTISDDMKLGTDGGIWFLSGRTLERFNPSNRRVDVKTPLAGTPIFISPTTDGLWVGTYQGTLVHLVVRRAK